MSADSFALGYPFLSRRDPSQIHLEHSAILQRVPYRPACIEPIRRVSAPIKARSVYDVYPPPAVYQLGPPIRVNPYHFACGQRKTQTQETDDVSHYMHERSKWMLQKEYKRFHEHWKPYYYGNKTEQEQYKFYIRQGLKQQMSDKEDRTKKVNLLKSKEARDIDELCQKFDEKILSESKAKREFLLKYRDANKTLIEQRAQQRKLERTMTVAEERFQLQFNPINWSCTLK